MSKATRNSTDMTIAVSWYVKQQQNKANRPKKISLILPCWNETKSGQVSLSLYSIVYLAELVCLVDAFIENVWSHSLT